MALHRLTSVTMGVPNVAETQDYHTQFGLHPDDGGWFSTQDGGRQLRIVPTPTRRLADLVDTGRGHAGDPGQVVVVDGHGEVGLAERARPERPEFGASDAMAPAMVDMMDAKNAGLDDGRARSPEFPPPPASASGARKFSGQPSGLRNAGAFAADLRRGHQGARSGVQPPRAR